MGHIRVPIHPDDNDFSGVCPFHGTCLEGLTSGPAIERRWGTSLDKLGSDHPATAMAAWYIAQAVTSYRAVLQPARIVLGGGVMAAPGLLDAVRQQATALGNGYFPGDPAECIVSPGLGDRAGLMGALALALNSTS
jgi:fructokinase